MTYSAHATPDPFDQPGFYTAVTTKRFLAWVVDVALITAICLVLVPFTAFVGLIFWVPFWFTISFLYRWATLAGGSATWGMRLMAIEIRDARGAALDGGTAFLHTLGYTVSVAVAPLQLVSVVLMLISARGQGLTDHLLGTVAINRRLTKRW